MTTETAATELPDDLRDVRRRLEQFVAERRMSELIDTVIAVLAQMRDSHNDLAMRLRKALRELYGRKSQKVEASDLSQLLAALGDAVPPSAADAVKPAEPPPGEAAPPEPPGNVPVPPEPPKPPRVRNGRSPLPPNLPRRQKKVPVSDAARVCPLCGKARVCIGHRASETLEFIPARFELIEELREKMACPSCPEGGVATAPSEKVMDRGRPGPGLLATIFTGKFADALPLYRQAQQFARYGVKLSPSTLGDWMSFTLDLLEPVAARIGVRVVGSPYVRGDDTGLRVLDRDHVNGVKRGHVWGFVGLDDGVRLVFYDYAPSWDPEHPAAVLQGFTGYFQGDAYAGYAKMMRDGTEEPLVPAERRMGCAMHIRAKFEEALKAGDKRAAIGLAYFSAIYRIEASCKTDALSPDERKARRDELSLPHVDKLYEWVKDLHPQLVPKTHLFVATQYAINQEEFWRRCFIDGRFEIDNGEIERQLRCVAIGRKNYLFAGSEAGARRLAIGYTLVRNCHMHGVNPLAWATDVIEKIQGGWPKDRLDELLPDRWGKPPPSTPAGLPSAAIDAD